jgi:hypothetical protein
MDYANKYVEKGFKTAMLDCCYSTHIGRRTYERDTKKLNAYDLNNEQQFGDAPKEQKASNDDLIEAAKKAHETGKKVLAAAKHAAKEFQEKHAKLNKAGHSAADVHEGTKEHQKHLQICINDANQTLEDLETTHADQDISEEEKTQLEQLQQELRTVVSEMQQLLVKARG